MNPVFALVFALITHWLGSAMEYLWGLSIARSYERDVMRWQSLFRRIGEEIDSADRVAALSEIQAEATRWLLGAGSVLTDPFKTFARILLQTLAVWMAARLFVPRSGENAEKLLSYRIALIVVCFSFAPSILSGVPLVGPLVSGIFMVTLMIIGVREVYGISSGRAILIALFPQLLIILAVVLFLMMIGVALYQAVSQIVGF